MKRREIFIELTSLLDVILILLFILLMQAKTTAAQAVDAATQAQMDVEIMATEAEEARRERDASRAEAAEQRARADEAEAHARAQEARADEQAERADALQRQLWTENLVLDNSLLLTVSVDKNGSIRLEKDGRREDSIEYDWADDTYARNRLRGLLLEEIRMTDREVVFLVFQYDRARVYHAEYEMIEGIVQEVKQAARARDIPLSFLEMDLTEA